MINPPPLSLYVHIPWCVQKCPYCDFNSHKLKGEIPHQAYVDHLLRDLQHDLQRLEITDRPLQSIFIGGGTPSLLSDDAMLQLLNGIRSRIELLSGAEITMEANPGTVESQRFLAYQQAGINRMSLGIQSFNDHQLQRLGRIHNSEEAIKAVKALPPLGSFNLDLMHGLPDQSPQQALADLDQAIALAPPHLSWYQLTIEPNTLFGSKPPVLPDDDALWQIYQQGKQRLSAAGYQQYETSAYAKVGYQCQHNLNYWRYGDYLAIGCGAHGKISYADNRIVRTVKTRHPVGFMQGNYLASQTEVAAEERPFEFFINRFRLFEPTPRADFNHLTGLTESTIRQPIEQAIEQGYLIESPQQWQLTDKGKLFLNSLLELFL